MIHHLKITQDILTYVRDISLRETNTLKALRNETLKMPECNMQILPEQGQFMALLVRLMQAKKALEIGVFTGYSSLCVAQALPDNGELIACDNNADWVNIGRKYWQQAGVEHKISTMIGSAKDSLQQLIDEKLEGSFDIAFIDADKENYDTYYEFALKLVRKGGLILLDNMLWSGAVVNSSITDTETESLRALNKNISTDERIDLSLLPFADGLTLALKR
ncbi:class I SAM-dependent methyltransferase [Zooshikella marina]|uniref:O-methyltransferase n=1 Tax=Zooshikella ganghwensis TaxID=202772 RepID=UPI001BB0D53B|nr:class I SAM-dependent methyltransferase [Zooshikella ganghwensis]MBU2704384.1 class I SAM-dependent methyltransferase [Zooshikella ganghwensis]